MIADATLPTPMDHRAFELKLRDLAASTVDENQRMALRGAADTLGNAINAMCVNRNGYALQDLNNVWAYAVRLMLLVQSAEPTPPKASVQRAA